MLAIKFKPIGIIHSPFKNAKGTPIQPSAARDAEGSIELFEEYMDGLLDLEGFSHIILIYHFHLARKSKLRQKPFMNGRLHGVFSIRSPSRPNPIGISVVRLQEMEGNILKVKGLDIIDGTPLLDIKPYVPEFDSHAAEHIGWLSENIHKLKDSRDNGRFSK